LAYFKESVSFCLQFSDSFLPEKQIYSTNEPHICILQTIKTKTKLVPHSFQSAMMLAQQNFHAASGWRQFLQSNIKTKK